MRVAGSILEQHARLFGGFARSLGTGALLDSQAVCISSEHKANGRGVHEREIRQHFQADALHQHCLLLRPQTLLCTMPVKS